MALAPVRPCADFCCFEAGAENCLLLGNHCVAAVDWDNANNKSRPGFLPVLGWSHGFDDVLTQLCSTSGTSSKKQQQKAGVWNILLINL